MKRINSETALPLFEKETAKQQKLFICWRLLIMSVYWISQQPHLVMTSSVINRNSNKADIIQGAEEYIDITDKQLKDLREEKQALVILLAVAASAAILF